MSRLMIRRLLFLIIWIFTAACSLTSNQATLQPTIVVPPTSIPNTVGVVPTLPAESTPEVTTPNTTSVTNADATISNGGQSGGTTTNSTVGGANTTVGSSSGSGSGQTPAQPSITQFTYSVVGGSIEANTLVNRTARVRMTWQVVNRPSNANLVFEQVLTDGTVVNVELPRAVATVSSSGSGDVAPYLPGNNANSITLRLRVVDLTSSNTLTSRVLTVPVVGYDRINTNPTITLFSTQQTTVDRQRLLRHFEHFEVRWEVVNRPPNANLVFEQIMPSGALVNIEVPREVVLVPSSGSGAVVPYLPDGDATAIYLQVRLVDISSGNTYTSAQLSLTLTGTLDNTGIVVYESSACLTSPFLAGNGIEIGTLGQVVRGRGSRNYIDLMNLNDNVPVVIDQLSTYP